MKIFISIIVISLAVLLIGCSNQNQFLKIPLKTEHPEAFQCTSDDGCTLQTTSCNNCNCPKAINKNYQIEIDCSAYFKKDMAYCNLYCFPATPKCINNSCVAVTEKDE